MASDAVKNYVRGVFDSLNAAGPEARQLLKEMFAQALLYHREILAPAKDLKSFVEKRDWFRKPRAVELEDEIKARLAQLKAHGINLLGYTAADICDAIVELYSQKPRRT